jgi:hypothetical protein
MEYVILIVNPKDEAIVAPGGMEEMGRFCAELHAQGKLTGGMPLHPEAEGVRVALRDGRAIVSDGPFAETKEVVAGFLVVEAESREEAVAIARRCPDARRGVLEVRLAPDRDVVPDAGPGPRFLLLLHMSPDLTDPDGSCLRAMLAFDDVLKREGSYVESSQLALDPPAARVAVRGGQALVTDGPFAETKEVAGGYYVVRAASRAEAVEIAKRCPHATNGEIEVRQEVPVDRR